MTIIYHLCLLEQHESSNVMYVNKENNIRHEFSIWLTWKILLILSLRFLLARKTFINICIYRGIFSVK